MVFSRCDIEEKKKKGGNVSKETFRLKTKPKDSKIATWLMNYIGKMSTISKIVKNKTENQKHETQK